MAQETTATPRAPLVPLSPTAAATVVAVWAVLSLVSAAWFLYNPRAIFVLNGCLAILIVSIPLVVRRAFDLVSPWSLVIAGTFAGFPLRGLFITLNVDGTRTTEELFIRGHSPEYFGAPSVLVLIGLAALTTGYIAGTRFAGQRPRRLAIVESFHPGRLSVAVLVLAVIGAVSFWFFAQGTGGFSLERISGKRTLINGPNIEASYRSHGEWRALNTFATVAFWLQLAHYAHLKVPHGPLTLRGVWLFLLLANASLLPFYASTRSDVFFIVITAGVIEFCLRKGTFNWRALWVAVGCLAALGTLLTTLRQADQGRDLEAVSPFTTAADTFVLTRTFSDLPLSAHIIKAVPNSLPYANGDSITSWLAAPIPRAVWPEKPVISLGPSIGVHVYGNPQLGIPPGVIAESYWNFGVGGILLIPLLGGLWSGLLYSRWANTARCSPASAVLLSGVAIRTGIDLTTNSVGYALLQAIQLLVLLVPVLWFIRDSKQRRARAGPGRITSRLGRSAPRGVTRGPRAAGGAMRNEPPCQAVRITTLPESQKGP